MTTTWQIHWQAEEEDRRQQKGAQWIDCFACRSDHRLRIHMFWANNGVVEPRLSTREHWQYLAALKLPGTRQLQLCTGRAKAKVVPKPPPRNTKRTGAGGIIGAPVEALMAQEITPPSFGLNTLHGLILGLQSRWAHQAQVASGLLLLTGFYLSEKFQSRNCLVLMFKLSEFPFDLSCKA